MPNFFASRSSLTPLGRVCLYAALFALWASPAPGAELVRFSEYDLDNGLHVILAPEHSAPVVATYVLYHVGSKDERADRTGFAHFFEHLMFEGSENIARGQLDKYVNAAGGNLNASTSFDETNYHLNLPSNQLGLALWIESERMLHAKIDEAGVETQRQVVKEERRLRYDNQPYGGLFEEMAKLVFVGTPYAWVPIGSVQYIDAAGIEEFRAFYKKYYLPNNATLVVAGDFTEDAARKAIDAYFSPIPRGPEPPRPSVLQTTQKEPRHGEVRRPNTPLPATLHAWRVPPQTHPDAYAIDLLTNILAGGRSSRLYRRLVDQEQAAAEAEAFPFLQEKVGMTGVFAVGNPDTTLEKLDTLITEELDAVKREGVTDAEFQKARNAKEAELAASYGTMAARARALATFHVFYGDTDLVNTELTKYLAVTREDLRRAANLYLVDSSVNILHYPPPDMASPGEK